MRTYVPERRRAEQRVDDRVDEDIRVGMSGEAGLAGKLDSAEDEATSFGETM